jgi:hypothetical protein
MAAINRVQYHPPPPISFCKGPRIIQKLKDVVELPLYIPSSLNVIAFRQQNLKTLLYKSVTMLVKNILCKEHQQKLTESVLVYLFV